MGGRREDWMQQLRRQRKIFNMRNAAGTEMKQWQIIVFQMGKEADGWKSEQIQRTGSATDEKWPQSE